MPKIMTYAGLAVAALTALVFALDLFTPLVFRRASILMDVMFIICALILGYLSWSTMREQV